MSRLYLSENGNVVPTLCEELTVYRRARKVLDLPPTADPGTLYVLACPYASSDLPLRLAVNGSEVQAIRPDAAPIYRWYDVLVASSLLRPGANTFEFWTDSTAMNAWSLAVEAGHAESQSFISDDGGRSWRNEQMGYLNVLRGEYVVRVRLAEGEDPTPPAMVWEDTANPRLESLQQIVPKQALQAGPLLARIRPLMDWICLSWEYRNRHGAAQYAPWDAETILAWGQAASGHNGQLPIVACLHYAVTMVSCCQAVGIPARSAIITPALDTGDGHFVTEVWFDEYGKWVMVDPNMDAIVWKDGVPLSITDIQRAGSDLSELIEWGPGSESQRTNPAISEWVERAYLRGACFRHRSIWPRADFLSHPELTPPGHGSLAFCETSLVWEKSDLQRGFGMFPYFADSVYFDAPPRLDG